MSDRLTITGRKAGGTEGLICDGRRLFHVMVYLLEGGAPADNETWDSLLMLASMGRDFMDEAARVWAQERRQ